MNESGISPAKITIWAVVGLVALIAISLGGCSGTKAYSRYQQRADRSQNRTQARLDASNQVQINQIRIGYFKQELKIAKQQAAIRQANAIGIREAQDKIAATLTPLYVQFEMVEALKAIATSGHNNSVVYLPSGPAGVPVITQDGKNP